VTMVTGEQVGNDGKVRQVKHVVTVAQSRTYFGVLQSVPSSGVCARKGDVICNSRSIKRCHTARLSSVCGMCTSANIATKGSCTAT
jgi:hypothetical protein